MIKAHVQVIVARCLTPCQPNCIFYITVLVWKANFKKLSLHLSPVVLKVGSGFPGGPQKNSESFIFTIFPSIGN